jgi:hypothetical protein
MERVKGIEPQSGALSQSTQCSKSLHTQKPLEKSPKKSLRR